MTVIYTPVPMEEIFQADAPKPKYEEVNIGEGKTLILERINENQSQVVRLLSTDCNDYLNPKYQPGCVINLHYM
ncbi:YlzJ-like family protein [Alkalicella caledoniensis]|uniref:YlzJ-like family protein n=1 Tax=Alkalicella caledoniensis TaxID=2731377 RepID=A0A7G9WCS0_ALKCA|nr:YlzJ-like family protein [Alkalicella caledoniensis]QNO16482.1 YlzJ-like family protein [Alkalicella caledoniensis]